VFGHGTSAHSGTIIMDLVAEVTSNHSVVVIGAGRAPAPCHLGEGMPEPTSPLEIAWNSLVVSSIMDNHEDGGPLRVEPMKVVPKSFLLEERLRPSK
jgi:hypothetical protein